jgi:hypothetical protein
VQSSMEVIIRRGKPSLKHLETGATVLTLVLIGTGQRECKPCQVRGSAMRLDQLTGMSTNISRQAASCCTSLKVVAGTETVQIPTDIKRTCWAFQHKY